MTGDLFERAVFGDIIPKIADAFVDYHKANPGIYDQFKRFAFELRRAGRDHFGAKAILERIRYETAITGSGEFKINNNFASCYARLLILDHPEFSEFFETRRTPGTVSEAA